MKIKPEHVEQFSRQLNLYKNTYKINLELYKTNYQREKLSPKRFRFDMLYRLPFEFRQKWYDEVYKYADDTHVDTMLKKLICNDKWE